jgi:hypothetical protein
MDRHRTSEKISNTHRRLSATSKYIRNGVGVTTVDLGPIIGIVD